MARRTDGFSRQSTSWPRLLTSSTHRFFQSSCRFFPSALHSVPLRLYNRSALVRSCAVASGRTATVDRYGTASDKVTTSHLTPEYPRVALALGIGGEVRVKVKFQNGRITEANALSSLPLLAYSAKEWIVRKWKFKLELNSIFTIPINYK